jgi:hypothetical protein
VYACQPYQDVPEHFDSAGRPPVKRQRLDVIMDFTTEEQLQELQRVLREESVKISATRLQTHIYVSSATAMAKLF